MRPYVISYDTVTAAVKAHPRVRMSSLGKSLIVIGLVIALIGVVLSFAGRIPWLGRLPGDIYVKRENFTFYFPLATSIIISLLLSFILWLFRK